MKRFAAVLISLFVLAVVQLAVVLPSFGDTTNTRLTTVDLPLEVTAHVTTASVLATDDATHGLVGKRAMVLQWEVNGQEVDVLVRAQKVGNGVWVDLVASDTVNNLGTAVGAMDLSGDATGHPAPTEDAADTAVLAAAGS